MKAHTTNMAQGGQHAYSGESHNRMANRTATAVYIHACVWNG
jgi:hypothetical protein